VKIGCAANGVREELTLQRDIQDFAIAPRRRAWMRLKLNPSYLLLRPSAARGRLVFATS
jgi:hypothetical protein